MYDIRDGSLFMGRTGSDKKWLGNKKMTGLELKKKSTVVFSPLQYVNIKVQILGKRLYSPNLRDVALL